MNAITIPGFGRVPSYTLRGPGDFDAPTDDRAEAEAREAERIEADADKVYELVVDNLDAIDSPICSETWPVDLLIALREAKPILALLCKGCTLEQAMVAATGADHFRMLLRCADTADSWIAELIRGAAADAVDCVGDDA